MPSPRKSPTKPKMTPPKKPHPETGPGSMDFVVTRIKLNRGMHNRLTREANMRDMDVDLFCTELIEVALADIFLNYNGGIIPPVGER